MLGSVGWQELLLVAVILSLVMGASRVSEVGRGLGIAVREFRRGLGEDADEAATPDGAERTADGEVSGEVGGEADERRVAAPEGETSEGATGR